MGANIPVPIVGVSNVEEHYVQQVPLELPCFLKADQRDAKALLVYLSGVAEGRLARRLAAHVGPMARVGDEGHQLSPVEDRRHEGYVGQV